MNTHYKVKESQEEEKVDNIFVIKDPYLDSKASANKAALVELSKLYFQLPLLAKANQEGNKQFIFNYFHIFATNIDKIIYNENNPQDFIEFIFPDLINLTNINTSTDILEKVLLSVLNIVSFSHYYSLKFANSSAYNQTLQIIQHNITDYITALSINIIVSLAHFDELHDILHSVFPIQSLFESFLSTDYKRLSKQAMILVIGEYLLDTTDKESLFQIFSCILQCLNHPNLDTELIIDFFCIIGQFYSQNQDAGIDFFPQGMIQFVIDHILDVARYPYFGGTSEVFYFIYILTVRGVVFNFPVEELYKTILDDEIQMKVKENIVMMISNSIEIKDSSEYSIQFITASLMDVINYCFTKGAMKMKHFSQILIATLLVTDNLPLFIVFLNSEAFPIFIEYISNLEDESVLYISAGILGNALHTFQKVMPNSVEFRYFISTILDNQIIDHLSSIECTNPDNAELFNLICTLISNEANRMESA